MFLLRYIGIRSNIWRNCLLKDSVSNPLKNILTPFRKYTGIACIQQKHNRKCRTLQGNTWWYIGKPKSLLDHRKYYSQILGGDESDVQKTKYERDLKKITQLFPQPRVTLNELTSKTPQKIFSIHYKQHMVAGRKKMAQGDWTCTYAFIWPEKMKFESTAISKRQAAEKAAIQALIWLYGKQRIDNKGSPIYDREVIDKLRDTINEPMDISVNEKNIKRVEKLWDEYETRIKPIYEATFNEAAKESITTTLIPKESNLDDDDFSDDEIAEEIGELSDTKPHVHPVFGKAVKATSPSAIIRRNRFLQSKFQQYDEEITPLPIDGYADQITTTLENSRVVVIIGAAGCGKSTRAPAAILRRFGANTAAIVTEPRRVAAIGLAQRVASELGEEVGESIGYQIRLQSKPPRPPGGAILYCTSGVLLRRLQTNPGLEGCSHVIIDEAHERDVNTDISLLLLKKALDINPQLKLVIMSATLDTGVFIRYFDECPVIEVPGRTFPVDVTYLEDIQKKFNLNLQDTMKNCTRDYTKPSVYCQEVVNVIKAVDKNEAEGAILVFLPGWAEIKAIKEILDEHFTNTGAHLILPVHSRLSTADQTKMFTKPMPGVRKIVLATNIAETSITIPDVVYVIDTGSHKENRLKDGTGTSSLETVWVSKAAAQQRAGRAGRVQPGHCYKLYTKEKENEFTSHMTPEILRIPLEQTVLNCKSYAPEDKVEDFLSQLPEPPSKKAIQLAVEDLIDLGALTSSERLTRLGVVLSGMGCPPRVGCTCLHGATVGVLPSIVVNAVLCAENVELFVNAADRRDEIREIKSKFNKTSDHAALCAIQDKYEQIAREQDWGKAEEWCNNYGLKKERLRFVMSLSNLYMEQMLKSGFIEPNPDPDQLNRFSADSGLLAAMLVAGVNALVVTRRHVKTKGKLNTVSELFTSKGERVHVGSESVNYGIAKNSSAAILAYYSGMHSAERRALVIYKTSLLPPITPIIFSKGELRCEVQDEDNEITVLSLPRHNISVHVNSSEASAIRKVREMYWSTFEYMTQRSMDRSRYDDVIASADFRARLSSVLAKMIRCDNR